MKANFAICCSRMNDQDQTTSSSIPAFEPSIWSFNRFEFLLPAKDQTISSSIPTFEPSIWTLNQLGFPQTTRWAEMLPEGTFQDKRRMVVSSLTFVPPLELRLEVYPITIEVASTCRQFFVPVGWPYLFRLSHGILFSDFSQANACKWNGLGSLTM